jgi:hypothetical protein
MPCRSVTFVSDIATARCRSTSQTERRDRCQFLSERIGISMLLFETITIMSIRAYVRRSWKISHQAKGPNSYSRSNSRGLIFARGPDVRLRREELAYQIWRSSLFTSLCSGRGELSGGLSRGIALERGHPVRAYRFSQTRRASLRAAERLAN